MTAARPTSGGLAVVLQLVAYQWPRRGDLRVTVEAGVGIEAAMDLAKLFGWHAGHGAFFARDPDRPSARVVCQSTKGADVTDQISGAADAAFVELAAKFRDVADLDAALVVQPRLRHTDLVLERVFVLAAAGQHESALDILRKTVGQLDDTERYDRGWRPVAARLHAQLLDWMDRGCPQPPSWASP